MDPLQCVIEELKKLPGIGPKSAQRLAFHLIRQSPERCQTLAEAISKLQGSLVLCSKCNNVTGKNPCDICTSSSRDRCTICVVEEPFNVLTIEKTGIYKGLYHVLHGAISPIDGIGPDDVKIKDLIDRVREGELVEVIVATNPTSEGEATALYLNKVLKPLDVKISRIALGIPVGSDLEYTDTVTIAHALSGRNSL